MEHTLTNPILASAPEQLEELTAHQEATLIELFEEIGKGLDRINNRLDTLHILFEDNIRDVREANDIIRQSNDFALVRFRQEATSE